MSSQELMKRAMAGDFMRNGMDEKDLGMLNSAYDIYFELMEEFHEEANYPFSLALICNYKKDYAGELHYLNILKSGDENGRFTRGEGFASNENGIIDERIDELKRKII